MSNSKANPVLRFIQKMRVNETTRHLSDEQLLNRFAKQQDTLAFEALLLRHGGMVLVVCRRVLANEQDAEDVFQATFLTLAHKARSIHKRSSIGCWLHGVAHRLALKARSNAIKRKAIESGRALVGPETHPATMALHEIQPILDEELEKIPERFRAPLVLCYLEGKTRAQAALQLGWSQRTMMRRIDKGHELLRSRLMRRGVSIGTAALTTGLFAQSSSAAIPARLVDTTLNAAKIISEGGSVALVVSTKVATLTQGVLNAMFLSKLKITSALVVATLAFTGIGFQSFRVDATGQEEVRKDKFLAVDPLPIAAVELQETNQGERKTESQTTEKPGREKEFENAPGFSWFLRPFELKGAQDPGSIQGIHFAGGSVTATQMHGGSLLFLFIGAEPTVKLGSIYQIVVFDDKGNRYLASEQGGGSSPNAGNSLFTKNYVLDPKVLSAAKVQHVGIETKNLQWTAFEDFAQFGFGGGVIGATGMRDKAGFTVVPMNAPKGRTKLCVSLAVKVEGTPFDYRVVAIDADNKRRDPQNASMASAGGIGSSIVTILSEFDLVMDAIKTLVVQRRKEK